MLALADHRPRLDSRVAAGMKQGGAVVLGKANLNRVLLLEALLVQWASLPGPG